MTVTQLRAILKKLPGDLKVHVGLGTDEEAVTFIGQYNHAKAIVLSDSSGEAYVPDVTLYDAERE